MLISSSNEDYALEKIRTEVDSVREHINQSMQYLNIGEYDIAKQHMMMASTKSSCGYCKTKTGGFADIIEQLSVNGRQGVEYSTMQSLLTDIVAFREKLPDVERIQLSKKEVIANINRQNNAVDVVLEPFGLIFNDIGYSISSSIDALSKAMEELFNGFKQQ